MKLEEIKRLTEAATPGPWTILGDDAMGWINELRMGYEGELPSNDIRFIAMARTMMPKLIAAIEAADTAMEEMAYQAGGDEGCRTLMGDTYDAWAAARAALEASGI